MKISFNNTYIFELKDIKENKIKQKVKITNIVLDNFWKSLSGEYTRTWIKPARTNIYFRDGLFTDIVFGSGNRPPKKTDTSLEKPLWIQERLAPPERKSFTVNKDIPNKVIFTSKYLVPANKNYVGEIREVGLTHFASYKIYNSSLGENEFFYVPDSLTTRAILKDETGRDLTIYKAANDELSVTVTVELNYVLNDFKDGFVYNTQFLKCFSQILDDIRVSPFQNFCVPTVRNTADPKITPKFIGAWLLYYQDQDITEFDYTSSNFYEANTANYYNLDGWGLGPAPAEIDYEKHIIKCTYEVQPLRPNDKFYCQGIIVPGVGRCNFPNYKIFPPQALEEIIGTGDGLTTEFKCPLNFFIKDSDKVYKNGVLLQRGIDYTIDNENNQDMLLEISLGNLATISGGMPIVRKGGDKRPIFKKFNDQYTGHTSMTPVVTRFTETTPLFFACKEPMKCNTLRMTKHFWNSIYTLSYSNDNIEYTVLERFQKKRTFETFTFNTIEAKYWKLEVDEIGLDPWEYSISSDTLQEDPYYPLAFIGYVGEGIKFTNPPEKGSLLTLEAQVDRPFINSWHPTTLTFNFSF